MFKQNCIYNNNSFRKSIYCNFIMTIYTVYIKYTTFAIYYILKYKSANIIVYVNIFISHKYKEGPV